MAYQLNKKLINLVPYEPISGEYEVRLDANESFISVSEDMRAQICSVVMQADFNRYPDPLCTDLREIFAKKNGVGVDNVAVGNGSDELISILMNSFLEKGDKVVTLSPDFSMYSFYCSGAECENVVLKKDENFNITVDEIITCANENNARMIIFSNPCNPTSCGIEAQEIRRLIKNVSALVVLDEAYMDFWDQSILSEINDYDNLIVLKTCSKAVGLAAIRLGFAVSNSVLTRAINAAKSPYNVNTLTQEIGKIILSNDEYVRCSREQILESKEYLYNALCKYNCSGFEVLESKTNFIYIKTDRAKDIFEKLKTHSIVVRCFGNGLRITAGTKAENEKLINCLDKIL
ncbi:MAG: histidinol-phosphate transaminase [Clostridia bacterium]|nr:histidinol-phosphate transaminase [Clostridia bacterium]